MGDFNVNLINVGKEEITHQLLKKLCRNDYTPQITLPAGATILIYIHR